MHLCPVYDMLPMAYAPLPGGELPRPACDLQLPIPREQPSYLQACRAATRFWGSVVNHERISAPFPVI